jgi:hypothetical protein
MNLKTRVERLERNRNRGTAEFVILRPLVPGEGESFLTVIKDGRTVRHGLVGPEEVTRLAKGESRSGAVTACRRAKRWLICPLPHARGNTKGNTEQTCA